MFYWYSFSFLKCLWLACFDFSIQESSVKGVLFYLEENGFCVDDLVLLLVYSLFHFRFALDGSLDQDQSSSLTKAFCHISISHLGRPLCELQNNSHQLIGTL